MGMDLVLVPIAFSDNWWLANNRLRLFRDYSLFSQIDAELGRGEADDQVCPEAIPLPKDVTFQWYDDEGLEERTADPYGRRLTYLSALHLSKVKPAENSHPWNKAVFAFIRALPPDTSVVLWWC